MAKSYKNRVARRRIFSRILIVVLCMVAFIIFLQARHEDSRFSNLKSMSDDITAPVMQVVTAPVLAAKNFTESYKARNRAFEENIRLKSELVRMRDLEARAIALSQKLGRFETILNVDTGSDISANPIAARNVSESSGPFVRSALVNAGYNKNVTLGNAVMTTDGLYGHIVRVGRISARILLITDLNSRIAVMSERSKGTAIMIGDNADTPRLDFLSDDTGFLVGDRIVTSGDDGVMPFGLPIGTVFKTADGLLKVKPFASSGRADWVLIYPFSPVVPPETPAEIQDRDADAGVPQ